jgi:hypothetical protein
MSGMKTQFSLRIIFAGILLLLVNGCATSPQTGGGPLVGTWTNSLGTVVTYKADGTFDVVGAKFHIWGNYTVAAPDTVTFQEMGGTPAKGRCHGPGVYKFSRPSENTLAFTLVNDRCKERIKNVTLAWHRK